MPVVLYGLERVKHARVMANTSSTGMQCIVHVNIVPVGGVGLSGAGLCSYFSVGPARVVCASGSPFPHSSVAVRSCIFVEFAIDMILQRIDSSGSSILSAQTDG